MTLVTSARRIVGFYQVFPHDINFDSVYHSNSFRGTNFQETIWSVLYPRTT